ncbi:hypothetical protein [Psychrobacter sp. K31L]|uniref:hypothetical protein n=1 Tax=Psychrobacter sp. K31L TaxID=2820758 RepID=UPI001B31F67D|nr:hypothetical protein [Psychrobacter sp. K31L]MBP3945125.1 hypothetical protein [Psychrobacter sp. K31L]
MDYPVMLYLGGLNSHAIAHDDDEYDKLTKRGYVTHAEAVKIEPKADDTPTFSGSFGDVEDQLAEANEHIELLEGAIEVKDTEILDLKGQVDSKDKAIAANHEHIDTLRAALAERPNLPHDDTQEVADLKAKLAIYEESKDVNGDGVVSYDEMEKDELKSLLDKRGVKYVSRDNLDDLIQKAKDSE